MTAYANREIRYPVLIQARVRTGCGLLDVSVCNISARGMLLQVKRALKPGSFIEILRPGNSFTGRVVWSVGKLAGIHMRERIDVAEVLRTGRLPDYAKILVRETDQKFRKSAVSDGMSRIQARVIQFVMVATAVAGLAWIAADTMGGIFHAPMHEVRKILHIDGER